MARAILRGPERKSCPIVDGVDDYDHGRCSERDVRRGSRRVRDGDDGIVEQTLGVRRMQAQTCTAAVQSYMKRLARQGGEPVLDQCDCAALEFVRRCEGEDGRRWRHPGDRVVKRRTLGGEIFDRLEATIGSSTLMVSTL